MSEEKPFSSVNYIQVSELTISDLHQCRNWINKKLVRLASDSNYNEARENKDRSIFSIQLHRHLKEIERLEKALGIKE